ncbi:LLM class flavin-dependent oxidoreductase [Myxococcota bacterium]|nr:LLM class flavin-dependent oxidoreductase [Myxococcota bacterium]
MAKKLRFGLWYDFRNPPQWKQDPTKLYGAIVDQCVRAEELGWDDIWLSEHHFWKDGYTPSMLPLGCAIAARTNRVEIGTSVLLVPMHDPVRVAEDAATLDVLSGGRLQLGLGVGYRVEEFTGFNIPRETRAGRMNEELEILRRLFSGEQLTYEGKFYTYRDVSLQPLPVQKNPKLWVGGFSEPAVRRAARLGDAYIAIGPIGPFADLYRQELEKNGKDPQKHEIAAGYMWLQVSRDPEARWKEAEKHFTYQLNCYAKWFSDAGMQFFDPVSSREELEAQTCHIVTPEEACQKIEDYAAETGISRFYGWAVPPGLPPSWADEHVDLMAKEVIPNFR